MRLHDVLSECVAVAAAAGPVLVIPREPIGSAFRGYSREQAAAIDMIEGLKARFVWRFKTESVHCDIPAEDAEGVGLLGLTRPGDVVADVVDLESYDDETRIEDRVRFGHGMDGIVDVEAMYLIRLALLSDIPVPDAVRLAIGNVDDDDVELIATERYLHHRNTGRAHLNPGPEVA